MLLALHDSSTHQRPSGREQHGTQGQEEQVPQERQPRVAGVIDAMDRENVMVDHTLDEVEQAPSRQQTPRRSLTGGRAAGLFWL